MSGTPATVALRAAGIPFTEHSYRHDPGSAAYGAEAAEALGVDPDRVFKTLLVDVDGRLVVGIVPVRTKTGIEASISEKATGMPITRNTVTVISAHNGMASPSLTR